MAYCLYVSVTGLEIVRNDASRSLPEGNGRQRLAILQEVRLGSHPLARGGTAPAPPESEDAFLQIRGPSSSYKYSVQSMEAAHPEVNHVSIRPAGYSSKPQSRPGGTYMKATESSQHKTAAIKALPFSDLGMKRPEPDRKQLYPELADIKRPLVSRVKMEDMTRPPCRGEDPATNGVRPPSRQTNLHSSIGLDLPPRPITPPNSNPSDDPFDKTWSYSLRGQATTTNEKTRAAKGNTMTPMEAKRQRWEGEEKPRFAVKAWEEETKGKKNRAATAVEMFPGPQAPEQRKATASRPASGAIRRPEIPIIVTRSIDRKEVDLLPKRRIQSAALYVPRNQTAPTKDKFPFKSSLGPDFLGLFE